jgi:hypothetical protein
MGKVFEKVKTKVEATMPDKAELISENHRYRDYTMLYARNILAALAAIFFILSFFFSDIYHIFKGIGYFSGAAAYVFELLLLTNCFKTKVPIQEAFMVYCMGKNSERTLSYETNLCPCASCHHADIGFRLRRSC